ncbi:MAG TPA: hypothetical protein VNH11_26560 [Pirellulales bacterium]|nr:hypothetical protein [Pirellulales bacterium]
MSDVPEVDLPLDAVDWSSWPKPPDALRARLLAETTKLVRRRARRRRLPLAAGWGLAYAAGIGTAWLGWPREKPPVAPNEPPAAATTQVAVSEAPRESTTEDLSMLSPEELRGRVAGAPRREQIRLLRLAGDRYLFGAADVESALDCYRQVIELTPQGDLAKRESDDSWLLAELKSSAAGSEGRLAAE